MHYRVYKRKEVADGEERTGQTLLTHFILILHSFTWSLIFPFIHQHHHWLNKQVVQILCPKFIVTKHDLTFRWCQVKCSLQHCTNIFTWNSVLTQGVCESLPISARSDLSFPQNLNMKQTRFHRTRSTIGPVKKQEFTGHRFRLWWNSILLKMLCLYCFLWLMK